MKLLSFGLLMILLMSLGNAVASTPEMNSEYSENIDVPQGDEEFQDEPLSQLPQDHIDEKYLQRVEKRALDKQTKSEIHPWVLKELQTPKNQNQYAHVESFIAHLHPQESYEFKWNLANANSKKRDYKVLISIFTFDVGDDLNFNKNPEEEQYVSIEAKSKFTDSFASIGKLYVEKEFTINFQGDSKFIQATNMNERDVLIEFDMQKQVENMAQAKYTAAKNEHFAVPSQKIDTIFEEFKTNDKSRTKMSKWEWGFLEREERYDEQMLKLTGVELLIILGTSIVQIYCIKSLFDHKRII